MYFCPHDLLLYNSSCASAALETYMLHAAKVNLLSKEDTEVMPRSRFLLNGFDEWKGQKTTRLWAGQQGQSHDLTAWCHTEVPQLLVQGAEATLVLHPTRVSAPWASQVYISSGKNLHQPKYTPSRTVASSFKTTWDISPRHIIVSWQLTSKHIHFAWNLMQRGPTWW